MVILQFVLGPLTWGRELEACDDGVGMPAGLVPRDPWWPVERLGMVELRSCAQVLSGAEIQAGLPTSEPVTKIWYYPWRLRSPLGRCEPVTLCRPSRHSCTLWLQKDRMQTIACSPIEVGSPTRVVKGVAGSAANLAVPHQCNTRELLPSHTVQ